MPMTSDRAALLEQLCKAVEDPALGVISLSKGDVVSLLAEIARLTDDGRYLREHLAPREVELSQRVVAKTARVAALEEALRWIVALDKDENSFEIDERCKALLLLRGGA